MFKTLSLNKNYRFDFNGNFILNNDTNIIQDSSDKVEICVDEKPTLFLRTWLGLLAHYEVPNEELILKNIWFARCESKVIGLKCQNLMMFSKPVEVRPGFFLIPGFLRFAVSEQGKVLSLKSDRILSSSIGPYGYPYVNILDPDKQKWRSVSIHILLARALVKNDSPETKWFVNHKDGNKLNLNKSNLEWVTSRENINHAFRNNLRKDNLPCRVLDTKTGEIFHFPSVGTAKSNFGLGTSKITFNVNPNIGHYVKQRLVGKRYEFKLNSDLSDWHFANGKNTVRVLKGAVHARNITSGEVTEAKTVSELAQKLKINVQQLYSAIEFGGAKAYGSFVARAKCNDAWPNSPFITKFSRPRVFKLTNIDSFEETIIPSLRKTIALLDIDERTFKSRLKMKRSIGKYLIEEL